MAQPEHDPAHHAADLRLHDSPAVRALYWAAGTLCVALGVIGLFVPILPTTPFMLLAAACYARASERFYLWLVNHRLFGPAVREWRRHRSIPWRTKLWAIGLMTATLSTSILLFVRPLWLQFALALMGVLLARWLYRIPSRDRPRAAR
ncbi:MAG: YbaN family protein [Betaproteobacteria bacterium]|nr:YbaN family protein [Betaproteobacteria bacterium]